MCDNVDEILCTLVLLRASSTMKRIFLLWQFCSTVGRHLTPYPRGHQGARRINRHIGSDMSGELQLQCKTAASKASYITPIMHIFTQIHKHTSNDGISRPRHVQQALHQLVSHLLEVHPQLGGHG